MAIQSKRKAQASFEYLTVMVIGMLILMPFLSLFQQYSSQSVNTIQTTVIRTIGQDMVNSAETVYYMGYPSRLTLQENFPNDIRNMTLTTDWSTNSNLLTFALYDGKNLSFFSKVNMKSNINSTYYSGGLKKILLETQNGSSGVYVMITFS